MANVDTSDLFAVEEETLGGLEDEFGPSFFLLLKNFRHNSDVLKSDHTDALRDRVARFLARTLTGFAEIYGMTDRSGSRQTNYRVAGDRLRAVQQHLEGLGVPAAKVRHGFAKAIGEDFFEFKFEQSRRTNATFRNSAQDADFRAVVIALTPAPIGVPTRQFRQRVFSEVVLFCRTHVQKRD